MYITLRSSLPGYLPGSGSLSLSLLRQRSLGDELRLRYRLGDGLRRFGRASSLRPRSPRSGSRGPPRPAPPPGGPPPRCANSTSSLNPSISYRQHTQLS